MHRVFVLIFCFSLLLCAKCRILESVSDDELLFHIKNDDNVVVLFLKNQCSDCDELENVLENIADELVESIQAVVIKVNNSPMVGIYDPSGEPALIYFRRGIPLLYHGPINEDNILDTIRSNRDPTVRELSDANFEHLTQAATGATTGDWLIFFYSNDCVTCQRLYAMWEGVAAALRSRANVARVNRLEAGISTGKRFNINKSPEFILLRLGKVYRYRSTDYNPKAFIEFALKVYGKDKGETVPPVADPLNDYIGAALNFLLGRPYILLIGVVLLTLTGGAVFFSKKNLSGKKENVIKTKKAK